MIELIVQDGSCSKAPATRRSAAAFERVIIVKDGKGRLVHQGEKFRDAIWLVKGGWGDSHSPIDIVAVDTEKDVKRLRRIKEAAIKVSEEMGTFSAQELLIKQGFDCPDCRKYWQMQYRLYKILTDALGEEKGKEDA